MPLQGADEGTFAALAECFICGQPIISLDDTRYLEKPIGTALPIRLPAHTACAVESVASPLNFYYTEKEFMRRTADYVHVPRAHFPWLNPAKK